MPTVAQKSYDLLVANFSRPYPSAIHGANPDNQSYTRSRTGFEIQVIQTVGRGGPSLVVTATRGTLDPFGGNPPPTGEVEVVSDNFANGSASLFVGQFELVSGRDFATGGGVAATAGNIATAINTLPGFSAGAVGAVVTVEGPLGQVGLRFEAHYRGGEQNFEFTYVADYGVLSQGIGGGPVESVQEMAAGAPNGVAP